MKKSVALLIAGAAALCGGAVVKKLWKEKYSARDNEAQKSQKAYELFYHWTLLHERGIGLEDYFIENGIENIAVMDMSPQGRRLIDELKETDVNVSYAIEKYNPAAIHETLEVLRLHDDELPPVDAVVVCSLGDFQRLSFELRVELGEDCKIIALETVILKTLEMNGLTTREGVLNPLTLKVSD